MKRELIIEKYGEGNVVAILDDTKIIDLLVDPPSNSNFYPPNTFVEGKIQRRVSKRGGYFIKLPNELQGFLKSKKNYHEGETVVLLSKVFFDEDKPQTFTDRLKIISKYFILKLGDSGFSFSRKINRNFDKDLLIPILRKKVKSNDGIFIICRSQIADISVDRCIRELEKCIEHHKVIKKQLSFKKKYYDGLAKKNALNNYDVEDCSVIEELSLIHI